MQPQITKHLLVGHCVQKSEKPRNLWPIWNMPHVYTLQLGLWSINILDTPIGALVDCACMKG